LQTFNIKKGQKMKYKKINGFVGVASKLSTGRFLKYRLWISENGSLYCQFEKNSARGVFSN